MDANEVKEQLRLNSISWQEKTLLILDFHEQQIAKHGSPILGAREHTGWGIRQTAASLNLSAATISYDLRIGRAIRLNPERYTPAKSRNHGIEILLREDSVKVEVKHARTFVSGSLIRVVQVNDHDHYLIRLDKPINAAGIDVHIICLPMYYCRTFQP